MLTYSLSTFSHLHLCMLQIWHHCVFTNLYTVFVTYYMRLFCYVTKYSLQVPFKQLYVMIYLIILIILDVWLISDFQHQKLCCNGPLGTQSHGKEFVSQYYQLILRFLIYIAKIFLINVVLLIFPLYLLAFARLCCSKSNINISLSMTI